MSACEVTTQAGWIILRLEVILGTCKYLTGTNNQCFHPLWQFARHDSVGVNLE